MVYNGYEITKLNNLRNLEEDTQLWFNINVCLFKREGWNLQLTNIYIQKKLVRKTLNKYYTFSKINWRKQ